MGSYPESAVPGSHCTFPRHFRHFKTSWQTRPQGPALALATRMWALRSVPTVGAASVLNSCRVFRPRASCVGNSSLRPCSKTALGRRSSGAVGTQVRKLEVAAQTLCRARNAMPCRRLLCSASATNATEGRGHVREEAPGPKRGVLQGWHSPVRACKDVFGALSALQDFQISNL